MKKIHPKRIAAGCGALALIGIVLYYFLALTAILLRRPSINPK